MTAASSSRPASRHSVIKRCALILVGLTALLALAILVVGIYLWPKSLLLSNWELGFSPLRFTAERIEWQSEDSARKCRLQLDQITLGYQRSGYFFHADSLVLSQGCKQAAAPASAETEPSSATSLPLSLPTWLAHLDVRIQAFELAGELSGRGQLRREHNSLRLQGKLTGGAALAGLPILDQDLPLTADLRWDLDSHALGINVRGASQLQLLAQGSLTPGLQADLSGALNLRDPTGAPLTLRLPFALEGSPQRQQLKIQRGLVQVGEHLLSLSNQLDLSWPNYRLSLQVSSQLPAELSAKISGQSAAEAQLQMTSEGQLDPLQLTASQLGGDITLLVTKAGEGSRLVDIQSPWQLVMAPLQLKLRPNFRIQDPDQGLALTLQGEIASDQQQLSTSLTGAIEHPQLSDSQLALEGELQIAPVQYQGRINAEGRLASQAVDFVLASAFEGDLDGLQLALLPNENQASWQATADQSYTLRLQPDAQVRVALTGEQPGLSWQFPARLLHPYGTGEIGLTGSTDLTSGGIDAQLQASSPFDYSDARLTANGVASAIVSLGGSLDTPLLTLQSMQASADLSAEGAPEARFTLEQLQVRTNTALNLLDPAALMALSLSATKADWASRTLPLPTLDLTLYPHALTRPIGFNARFSQGTIAGQYHVEDGDLSARIEQLDLPPFAALIDPVLNLASGQLSGDIALRSATTQPTLETMLQIEDVGGEYTGHVFQQLATSVHANGNAEQLQASGRLSAGLLNTGLPITDFISDWKLGWQPDQIQAALTRPEAQILGGQFSADVLRYPSSDPQTLLLQGVDLAEASALQSEPVVDLKGSVELALPLTLAADGISIHDGRLVNRGPIEFTVLDPQLLDQYSQGNLLLRSVLDPLKQMKIALFSADISMAKSGDALIQATIHGKNPSQSRPVHLNYRHQENLFDLLKSLRMSDSFQRQIEQQVEQQYSHEDKALNPGR